MVVVPGAATDAVDDGRFRFFFSFVVCFFFVKLLSTIGGVVVTIDAASGTVRCPGFFEDVTFFRNALAGCCCGTGAVATAVVG